MEFVDTHCHPHFDAFLSDPQKMLSDSAAAGVKRIIAVGTTVSDSMRAADFAQKYENVWASVGVHPHEAGSFLAGPENLTELDKILNKSSIVAIGEIGLDYYKDLSPRDLQEKALRIQIESGLKYKLPFIFHVRDAWKDFWRIFDDYLGIAGVIHSFSAGQKQLDQVLARDLYVGLNGIMTFTRDKSQLAAAKTAPLDKLLLETDAPFLAPVPFRGQTCEPRHVVNTAQFLAELRGEELETLASATTLNAEKVFCLEENNG